MAGWIERLLGETQAKILALLRRSRHSITELARSLRLTDNAVRTHIAALRRDGIVADAGLQRDTGGKPARLYDLTREGEELFPKAYALVLGELVAELARAESPGRAREALEAVGRRLAASHAVRGAGDERARIAEAAAALRAIGAEVEVQQTAGGWRLQGHGCPLSAVTASQPDVCALAHALVAAIVAGPVRECCDRSPERPRCAFEIG